MNAISKWILRSLQTEAACSMFSGCRTQGTVLWTKRLTRDERPIFFHAVVLLRHFWTAHVNDCKRNDRVERLIQVRVLHIQATTERQPGRSALADYPKSNHPILFLPSRRDEEHQSLSTQTDDLRKLLESGALNKIEEEISVDRSALRLPISDNDDEDLQNKAARALRPAQVMLWNSPHDYRRSIERQIHVKSSRSFDWKRPLKLLKAHYRATSRRPQDHGVLTVEPAKSKLRFLSDTIPEPKHWTKATFDRYVYDLTRFKPPPLPVAKASDLRRQRRGPHTIPEVGESLHSLFHHREMSQFFEPKVCNAAIEFLSRHAMLSQARSIFFVMENLSIPMPVSTINIFMRAAAHQKDLHTFSLLLDTMIERCFNPDAETWVIFVQCLDSIAARRSVVAEMATLGILNQPGITAKVLTATVKDDLIDFLADTREPRDFLDEMRFKHGPDWMSRRTGNIVLNEVCKRASLSAGLDLIEPMKRHGFSPSPITLNIPLFQALASRPSPLSLATSILETFAEQHPVQFDRELWGVLFSRAWNLGYLNVTRVVWIAACLNGSVTHRMEQKVLYSLRQSALRHKIADYVPTKADPFRQPRTKVFKSLMGKFIIGLDPLKHASWNEGHRALRECLKMAKTAKLRFTLTFNLKEAYKVDCEWKSGEAKDLNGNLEHRYPVLLDRSVSKPHKISSVKPRRMFDRAKLVPA